MAVILKRHICSKSNQCIKIYPHRCLRTRNTHFWFFVKYIILGYVDMEILFASRIFYLEMAHPQNTTFCISSSSIQRRIDCCGNTDIHPYPAAQNNLWVGWPQSQKEILFCQIVLVDCPTQLICRLSICWLSLPNNDSETNPINNLKKRRASLFFMPASHAHFDWVLYPCVIFPGAQFSFSLLSLLPFAPTPPSFW